MGGGQQAPHQQQHLGNARHAATSCPDSVWPPTPRHRQYQGRCRHLGSPLESSIAATASLLRVIDAAVPGAGPVGALEVPGWQQGERRQGVSMQHAPPCAMSSYACCTARDLVHIGTQRTQKQPQPPRRNNHNHHAETTTTTTQKQPQPPRKPASMYSHHTYRPTSAHPSAHTHTQHM
jgi:hypothetical protein